MDMNMLDQDAAVGRARQRQTPTEDVSSHAPAKSNAAASQWLGASDGDGSAEPLTEVRIPSSAPPNVRPAQSDEMRRVVPVVVVEQVHEQPQIPATPKASFDTPIGGDMRSEPRLFEAEQADGEQVRNAAPSVHSTESSEKVAPQSDVRGAETVHPGESALPKDADPKANLSATIALKLKRLLASIRQKEADRKAAQKRQEEDEKNKKASVKKRNPAKIFAVIVILGILLSVAGQRWRNSVEQAAAADSASKANKQKAIAAATALLDSASSPTSASQAPAAQPAAPAPAQSTPGDTAQFTPPPAPCGDGPPGEDKYMKQLRLLKCDLKNSPDMGKRASRFPEEIAGVEIPGGRHSGGEVRRRAPAEQDPEAPRVPELIESSEQKSTVKPDPLARVAVLSSLSVDRAGTSPYLLGQARQTQNGPVAFIFPKNADPLISGRWFYVGDQTDEGWTVVSIASGTVNIVSPQGKVYQIHS